MKLFITGSNGKCGTALKEKLQYDAIYYDLNESHNNIIGDITDYDKLVQSMKGCNIVIHLAASSKINSPWEDILKNNIIGIKNILDASVENKIEKIIFASSNHVQGMYEKDNFPNIYEQVPKKLLNKEQFLPDSLYGVSKIFGENLGYFYSKKYNFKFFSLRIGAVVDKEFDSPYNYAEKGVIEKKWERNSIQYKLQVNRLKCIWLARDDFVQLIELLIHYDKKDFDIFYGMSENEKNWFDMEYTKQQLGYKPKYNAEKIKFSEWK